MVRAKTHFFSVWFRFKAVPYEQIIRTLARKTDCLQDAWRFAYEQDIMVDQDAWHIANVGGGMLTADTPLVTAVHIMNNKKMFEPIPAFTSRDRAPLVRVAGGKPYVNLRETPN